MWVFDIVQDHYIIQLDIQILIHALQGSANGNVVFELDRHFVVHQRFEEAVALQISIWGMLVVGGDMKYT